MTDNIKIVNVQIIRQILTVGDGIHGDPIMKELRYLTPEGYIF